MPDLIKTSLGVFTAPGIGFAIQGQAGTHQATVTVQGAASVAASVTIRGSNDQLAWTDIGTASPSGTGVATATVSWSNDYLFWRADVASMTGERLQVSVASDQTGGASSPGGSGSGTLTAADLATLNSTYPAASNAGKSAYVTSLSAFYDCNGSAWVLRQAGGGPYVMTSITPKTDQLNTPATNKTTTTLAVDGRYLRIDYRRTGAASNGTVLYVALNATTNTEADMILGSPSLGRYAIPIGSFLELEFPAATPLRRVDFCSDAAAETANSTITTLQYGTAA